MAGSRALKNRIRSTKNIRQMTRAMEAVSAVKMRRSQMFALAARPYALTALAILREAQKATGGMEQPSALTLKRPLSTICLVVVTSDKGLAGAFNVSVIKKAEKILASTKSQVSLVAIGKKGRDYFTRRGKKPVAEFLGTGDLGAIDETKKISDFLVKLFTEKKCDEVVLVYTNFLSALKQEVVVRKLLPFSSESLQEIIDSITPLRGKYTNMPSSFEKIQAPSSTLLLEPSPTVLLDRLLPHLLAVEIFHAILEANASEHSSRMMAMKNASESAAELVDTLNILFNKTRQAAITKELTEITAGREALAT
ncbi:MAG: ATP synthase F1 subunit gamma [Candidatus Taylorbacteria bacterium RIFCSPHIGHO2_01_FULL_46_22b]|uniref:ATP synthase gamma chain n=1 Tax=Candidatus Taylorbacteria bacterium RIFCSPHIGHO2_01_FULL_46_22b TaxID=1802301 RepID=A0A1G2M317_9BACT|nr:MAG: ATP synthase F1 subunit gamma [Candidatus Taylorbacteria bacterium RIFCSPHIGHO2_01_FULL_46_22b]